jgi:hypothetical protein
MGPQAAAELIHAAAAGVAVARLLQLRLARLYPALLSYVAFVALLNLALGLQNSDTLNYFYSYWFLEPLKCAVAVVAVRQLFAVIFDNYPGIRTAGRWAMYTGISIAVIVSILVTVWTGGANGRSKIFYLELWQRCIIFPLALVIIAILCCISRYPLHLGRNTLLSSAFFSAIFLSDALRLFLDSLTPYLYNLYVDRAESVFECIFLLTWAVLLKPQDDTIPARAAFTTPREDHLLQQLAALNQMMARAARR